MALCCQADATKATAELVLQEKVPDFAVQDEIPGACRW